MILFSRSTVTTSVMQLGEQEWLTYLRGTQRITLLPREGLSTHDTGPWGQVDSARRLLIGSYI